MGEYIICTDEAAGSSPVVSTVKPIRLQLITPHMPNHHEAHFISDCLLRGVPVQIVTSEPEWIDYDTNGYCILCHV